jgi:hypothetical protein
MWPYVGKNVANLTLAQIKTLDCGSLRIDGFPFSGTSSSGWPLGQSYIHPPIPRLGLSVASSELSDGWLGREVETRRKIKDVGDKANEQRSNPEQSSQP